MQPARAHTQSKARGTLRTVAATTWAEYKKYFEKDPALTRRFQVIRVEEPSEEKAVQMMRRLAAMLEKHHRVQLLDEEERQLAARLASVNAQPDAALTALEADVAAAREGVCFRFRARRETRRTTIARD